MQAWYPLIPWLLNEKFAPRGGRSSDAKSAWNWLVDQRVVPRTIAAVKFVDHTRRWAASVDVFCVEERVTVLGRGVAADKRSAEREAFLDALLDLHSKLQKRHKGPNANSIPPVPVTPAYSSTSIEPIDLSDTSDSLCAPCNNTIISTAVDALDITSAATSYASEFYCDPPGSANSTSSSTSGLYHDALDFANSEVSSTSGWYLDAQESVSSTSSVILSTLENLDHANFTASYASEACGDAVRSMLLATHKPTAVEGPEHERPFHTRKQAMQVEHAQLEFDKFADFVLTAQKSGIVMVVAIDVEKHDLPGRNEILEVGIDFMLPSLCERQDLQMGDRSCSKRIHMHLIVKEYEDLQNRFCINDRSAYAHGTSVRIGEVAMMKRLRNLFELPLRGIQSAFVGHTLSSDIRWLERRSSEMQTSGAIDFSLNFRNANTIDIALIDRAVQRHFASRKLVQIGEEYGVEFVGSPHNAGNDAVFTMDAWLAMARNLLNAPVHLW